MGNAMASGRRSPPSPAADAPPPARAHERTVVHVVAGVIEDARGRILLGRRTAGRDLAGSWEFPGGKVDRDETPEQALARELHEELGIRVHASTPLIAVPHAYPHKRIVLDVRRVTAWSGRASGREKQALTWAAPQKLDSYPMPAADRPVVAALRQADRYLVLPEPDMQHVDAFLDALDRALASGIRRVQLRSRALDVPGLRALAQRVQKRLRPSRAELLINCGGMAEIELARELGAGVHLRAALLMQLAARPLDRAGGDRGASVAASCHDAAELAQAEALGLDFAVLGPVRETASHPVQAAIGWPAFAALRETVSLPIYALGGMGVDDLAQARAHGAQGIAAIRSLWPAATTI
jgi:8-oxo-dGTP diphosphatase